MSKAVRCAIGYQVSMLFLSVALSLPFDGGGSKIRFGELAIAVEVNDGSRRPGLCDPGDR